MKLIVVVINCLLHAQSFTLPEQQKCELN